MALTAARAYPERVAGVAALGAVAHMRVLLCLLADAREQPERAIVTLLARDLAPHPSGRSPGIAMHGLARRLLAGSGAGDPHARPRRRLA